MAEMTSPRRLLGLAGAVFAFLTVMLGTTMPTVLYPLYRQEFGFSEVIITVIFAVYAGGVITALLAMGRWSDQIGRRPMLLLGLICAGASDLIFWQAQGLGWLLAGRFVSGLSAGIYTGAATVAVIELAGPRLREAGTFAAIAANLGGLGVGPLFAASMVALLPGPLAAPYLSHLALAGIAVLLILAAPETVHIPSRPRLQFQRLSLPREVVPVFVPAAIAAFAGFMVAGFFTAVSPAYLGEVLGRHSPFLIGLDVASLLISSVVGQLALGLLPSGRRLPIGVSILFCGVVILAAGLGLALLWLIFLGAMVAGFGHGIGLRAGLGNVAHAAPETERAGVTSTFFTVAYVAISLPVVGVGLASAEFGLRATSLGFAGIVATLCLIAIALLLRGTRRGTGRGTAQAAE